MSDGLPAWLIPLIFGLMGACIGSFLNVVIYRTPLGISVNDPARSFCPECEEAIPWYLNIPVLSWLALRGKSRLLRNAHQLPLLLRGAAYGPAFRRPGVEYADASAGAAILLCLWTAMAIVIMFIDAEHLIRTRGAHRRRSRVGACALYPFLLPDNDVMTWTDAFTASVLGESPGMPPSGW